MAKDNPARSATTKRVRVSDPWIKERANIVATYKAGGGKGIPQQVKERDFNRLGLARTRKAIKAISQLRALANTAQYSYSTEQVAKMLGALNAAVENVGQAFEGRKAVGESFNF